MNSIYLDSLPIEMLSKELYAAVNNIAKFMSYAKIELIKQESEGKIGAVNVILGNFNQVLLDHYVELADMNSKAIEHNIWMSKTLEGFETYLDDMGGYVMGQEHVNEERYEYYMNANEHDFKREENLYELINKACTKWKVEFKANSN
jgi:hypothetical protein